MGSSKTSGDGVSSTASSNNQSYSTYGTASGPIPSRNVDAIRSDGGTTASGNIPSQYQSRRRRALGEGHRCRPRVAFLAGFCLTLVAFFTIVLLIIHSAQQLRLRGGFDESSAALSDRSIRRHALNAHYALESGLNEHAPSPNLHEGCEATIMLIRHCEKGPHTKGHCSYLGYERAYYLASLFEASTTNTANVNSNFKRWPKPSYLYATKVTRIGVDHDVFREIDTLTPLSRATGVPIQYENFGETGVNLAAHIHSQLRTGELCGKLAVVSWKHELIPGLAEKLGCGPLDGCPMEYPDDEFDTVWQLKFLYSPQQLWQELPPRVVLDCSTSTSSVDNSTIVTKCVPSTNKSEESGAGIEKNTNNVNSNNTESDTVISAPASSSDDVTPQEDVSGKPSPANSTNDERLLIGHVHHSKFRNLSSSTSSNEHKWRVFGTLQYQNFDPLNWSYQSGDYPPGGKKRGGRWMKKNVEDNLDL